MNNILQFSNTFAENGSKMDTGVKIRYSLNEVQSSQIPQVAVSRNQSQSTDAKIWNIVRGLFDYGPYTISIARTKKGGYAEIKNRITGEFQVATVEYPSGTEDLKFAAGEINTAGAMSEYNTNTRRGSVLVAACLGALYESDGEIQGVIRDLEKYIMVDPDSDDWTDAFTCDFVGTRLCILTSNLYYRTKDRLSGGNVKVRKLRMQDLKNLEKAIEKVHFGVPEKVDSKRQDAPEKVNKGDFSFFPMMLYHKS